MLAYHAWKGNQLTKGITDYYIGGRSLGGAAIGLSFFATYSSTNSFVGFAGKAYIWGLPWLLIIPFVVLFSFLAWIVVAPRLRKFTESLDSLTIPDFIGMRFGSNLARIFAAFIILFASFFYMTAVFKGIGNLLEAFLDIPYKVAIIIVFFIVVIYTMLGGFISVVKTDTVQGVVMIFAAIILFIGIVDNAGGIGSFLEVKDQSGGAELFSWNGIIAFPFLLGVIFASTVKFLVEPRQLSRFYALKGRKAVKTGIWVSTLSFALVYSVLVPIGIYARRIFPEGISDSDRIVPLLITSGEVFSDGVSAFLLVAMVAAAMSSIDSVLLVMASTAERDIIGMLKKSISEKSVVKSTRFYVALFALITMLLALNPPGGIVTLTALSGTLYAACFFPTIILGLYWRKGSGSAVISSFSTGLAVLLVWKYTSYGTIIHQIFPAMLFSFFAYVLVSLRTPEFRDKKINQLFSKSEVNS